MGSRLSKTNRDNKKICHINKLNDDVMFLIFEMYAGHDYMKLEKLALVSRRFYEIARNKHLWFKMSRAMLSPYTFERVKREQPIWRDTFYTYPHIEFSGMYFLLTDSEFSMNIIAFRPDGTIVVRDDIRNVNPSPLTWERFKVFQTGVGAIGTYRFISEDILVASVTFDYLTNNPNNINERLRALVHREMRIQLRGRGSKTEMAVLNTTLTITLQNGEQEQISWGDRRFAAVVFMPYYEHKTKRNRRFLK